MAAAKAVAAVAATVEAAREVVARPEGGVAIQ